MQSMIDSLAMIHVAGIEIPLMDFKFDAKNLVFLEDNINQFDFVIIPSPAVIDYAKKAISTAYRPAFITVGKASAAKINKLTHKDVIYPVKKFGYYPGSLGNYAGHERNIFTLTLKIPSSDPERGLEYFQNFNHHF